MPLPTRDIFNEAEWRELRKQMELSARQGEVTRCLLRGLANKQIAGELGITVPTVRMHFRRLFVKLDVADRQELTLLLMHEFRRSCGKAGCQRR